MKRKESTKLLKDSSKHCATCRMKLSDRNVCTSPLCTSIVSGWVRDSINNRKLSRHIQTAIDDHKKQMKDSVNEEAAVARKAAHEKAKMDKKERQSRIRQLPGRMKSTRKRKKVSAVYS
mmetsp:Transcript_5098/g.12360  ORF Transcript_5098/g.12360 Transcript_5098/m.12360 type:complete len:119 (+) Transcript_5098:344-700(+)